RIEELSREYEEMEGEPLRELPPEPEKVLRDKMEEMRSLEPVNLRAIEEYEELKEKVEEVKERIRKLEEERKAILDLINEIEKKKREVFMETFRGLARKFEEVYAELTGGKARLRLTDEKNIFEAGLIIEATPKGKALTNMDALSGGEKAMVALAFIFATALFRPAPFYVLDEPDLMLDKINAEKMAKYIKKLSRTAQFIVVSHRDVVLKEADQIIGVYLGKDGSSVVEVRVPQAVPAS
ncbi:MAG: AAA family ATPase, partial [Candidatus Diapherotrites archaeon]|nr:AAA family ATPase [Candidatus Diapherotrites archaeon]